MKRFLLGTLIVAAVAVSGWQVWEQTMRRRTVVILSTNDIHAKLDNFARLATAVERCRDTVQTLLVDAGDRWTGNAFVDLADGRLPIIELMNRIGYDAVTLGNHEFDCGPALLQNAIEHSSFKTLCANMRNISSPLQTPDGSTVMCTDDGIRLLFAGVVNNDDYGHPDGSHPVFEGLEFSNPYEAAEAEAEKAGRCDVKVLLSHMSLDHDVKFAERSSAYDIIIGGHSHDVADTEAAGTVIGQTGRRLQYVGATTVSMKGRRIENVDYRNIPLAGYPEDAAFAARVREIESNPELTATVGTLGTALHKPGGLPNMLTELVAAAAGGEIGFYHYGGIRKDVMERGEVSHAMLFDLEPFNSTVYRMEMTVEQMRNFIILKYNDTGNPKEAHRVDLFCTTPYTIITDADDMAVDVRFPRLKKGRTYIVGMPNYIAEKYAGLELAGAQNIPVTVLDLMVAYFEENSPVRFPDNVKQKIVVRK